MGFKGDYMKKQTNNIIKQFEPLFALDVAGNVTNSDYFNNLRNADSAQRVFYMYFFNLVTNMFKWENLPESMDAIYLEEMLCLQGKCACVNDKNLGLLNPQYTAKKLDMYGRPNEIDAIANDYQGSFDSDRFVIIRNTSCYVPTFLYIDYFVQRIIRIDDVAEINLNAQKTPVVFSGSREQRELLKNEFQQYDGNSWYMFLTKDVLGNVTSLNTNAPYLCDKFSDLQKYYIDMFLSFIGLNNANGTFKRERSLVDEVTANNEIIGLTCESMLKARQEAVDKINEKFSNELSKPIEVHYADWVEKMHEEASTDEFTISESEETEEGGESDE